MAFATDITSSDVFEAEVLSTPGILQVVECHAGWAGPCKAVASSLRALSFTYSDRPIKFYTVDTDKVQHKALSQYKSKCQPVFLLYKGGVLKQTVVGVQGPVLAQAIVSLSDPSVSAAV